MTEERNEFDEQLSAWVVSGELKKNESELIKKGADFVTLLDELTNDGLICQDANTLIYGIFESQSEVYIRACIYKNKLEMN